MGAKHLKGFGSRKCFGAERAPDFHWFYFFLFYFMCGVFSKQNLKQKKNTTVALFLFFVGMQTTTTTTPSLPLHYPRPQATPFVVCETKTFCAGTQGADAAAKKRKRADETKHEQEIEIENETETKHEQENETEADTRTDGVAKPTSEPKRARPDSPAAELVEWELLAASHQELPGHIFAMDSRCFCDDEIVNEDHAEDPSVLYACARRVSLMSSASPDRLGRVKARIEQGGATVRRLALFCCVDREDGRMEIAYASLVHPDDAEFILVLKSRPTDTNVLDKFMAVGVVGEHPQIACNSFQYVNSDGSGPDLLRLPYRSATHKGTATAPQEAGATKDEEGSAPTAEHLLECATYYYHAFSYNSYH